MPGALQQPVVRSVLLSRLDTENQIIRQTLRDSHDQKGVAAVYGEDYGEYVGALGDAVEAFVDWEDSATLRILAQQAFKLTRTPSSQSAAPAKRLLTPSEKVTSMMRTSMIRTCQGKTELPLHSEERPESR